MCGFKKKYLFNLFPIWQRVFAENRNIYVCYSNRIWEDTDITRINYGYFIEDNKEMEKTSI